MTTANSKSKARTRLAAAFVVAALAVGGAASPAAAAWALCPSGANCWWREENAGGRQWPVWEENTDLSRFGIHARSGFNNGTTGMRACGFASTHFRNLNYSAARGERKNFTVRAINSNGWTWGLCRDFVG
jgi:hypothetical protein